MKSFHIITFGCQMNEHDSERMSGLLEKDGLRPVDSPDDAEMIIVNTCSIREKAEQKVYSEIGRLARLRRPDGSPVRIAVAGCIAQQEGARILSRAPSVDLVIGPSDILRLPELVRDLRGSRRERVRTAGDPDYHVREVPASRADRLKAWVSIMYGCDNFCTYCVVPYLRGRERSRPADDIIREVQGLANAGYREVTLLGQNVNSYGKGADSPCGFPELLARVNAVPGLERIRFVTSHPKDLSDGLIDAIRELPKVCEALHLPVQSGSDRILKAMNRRYTASDYLEKVKKLRAAVPDIVLTTDIIVGFPGEDEHDFQATRELLREVRYDNIFAFKYSQRPNTAALRLEGHVPEPVKEDRLEAVFDLQKPITRERNERHVGTVVEVLFEGASKRGGQLSGRTRGNKVVNAPGSASLAGKLAKVRVKRSGPNSLSGELCE